MFHHGVSRWMRRPPLALRSGSAVGLLALSSLSCGSSATDPGGGASISTVWYQGQPGSSYARPAVLGSTVYFGGGGGLVIARDVATGTAQWSTQASQEEIQGARLVARSGVVVAPTVHSTVGLDAQTGAVLWTYQAPLDTVAARVTGIVAPGQVVQSRIDADDQTVYIPAWGASVSAVDLKTGAVRWVWQPGRAQTDTAAAGMFRSGSMGVRVSGDTVFATVWHDLTRLGVPAEGWLVALDRQSGRELWRVTLPDAGGAAFVWSAPELYGNLVLVNTLTAHTYAFDRTTHQLVWSFYTPAGAEGGGGKVSTTSGVAVYGNVAYVDGGDSQIHALNASTGAQLWSGSFPTEANDDLLVTAGRVIFGVAGRIFVLDRQTGRLVASAAQPQTNDALIASSPTEANGRVFVTVAGGAWCFQDP